MINKESHSTDESVVEFMKTKLDCKRTLIYISYGDVVHLTIVNLLLFLYKHISLIIY